jgi:hypothetical protein
MQWSTLCLAVKCLNEMILNSHLQAIPYVPGMSWQSTCDAVACVVWLLFWLIICALKPVVRRGYAAFTHMKALIPIPPRFRALAMTSAPT